MAFLSCRIQDSEAIQAIVVPSVRAGVDDSGMRSR